MNAALGTSRTSAATAAIRPERLRLTHVEGLRAISALVVFVNHAYAQAGFPGHEPGAPWYLSFFRYSMAAGHLAVSVFIVISGFCLALPVVDAGDQIVNGVRQFIKRRARRILPPYYFALALSLILIATIIGTPTGTLWDVPIQADWKDVVVHVLLLQDFFGTGKINYVFWSIAVEWQIYFLFPPLVWVARRVGIFPTALGALALGYLVLWAVDGTRVERANPHFFGLFVLGMLAAHIVRSPRMERVRERSQKLWAWLALVSFAIVCVMCRHYGDLAPLYFPSLDLPVGVMAFALLIHSTLRERSLANRVLNVPGIVLIGTFSYSVYLVHAPLLQVIWQYGLQPLELSKPWVFVCLCSLGAALVLSAAYVFFLVCEKPFMRAQRPAPVPKEQPAPVRAAP